MANKLVTYIIKKQTLNNNIKNKYKKNTKRLKAINK